MNKKLKFFNELKTTENLKQKIISQTIDKKTESQLKFKRFPKLAYSLVIIGLISFISCTVVFAATYIHTYVLSIRKDKDGTIHQSIVVKEPVNIKDIDNFSCEKGKALEEIEDTLEIKFVNNAKYNSIIDKCDTQKNDIGKTESISLYIYDYVDYSKENSKIKGYDSDYDNNVSGYLNGKHIGLTISFMTINASDEVKEKFANLNYVETGFKMETKEIIFDDINVLAHYYEPIRPGSGRFTTYVVFVHNNIVYTFQGYRVSVEEIIKVINKLKVM